MRVMAFYMHEAERDTAQRIMPQAESTDSFALGEADDAAIAEMRANGLIIQEMPETQVAAPPLGAIHGDVRVRAFRRAMDVANAAEIPPDLNQSQFYLVWLAGPLLESWKAQLQQTGVELLEALPTGAYKVRLEPGQAEQVRQLSFVAAIRLYDSAATGPDLIVHANAPAEPPFGGSRAMLTFDVRLHRAEDAPSLRAWLEAHNIAIAGVSPRKIRIYLLQGAPELFEIPALPEVATFEEYVPPKLHNDAARRLLRIDAGNPVATLPLTGAGQIVAVADTGLDSNHPDFQGRIVSVVALGRPNDSSDPNGHGTHVAGSVLGNGSASNGQVRGTAPGAQLFFQSIMDANGELGGLPVDLNDLFDEAYQAGARIHNNSWGAATASRYTVNSVEVDEFVANHRDMLIVISAGNEGIASAPRTNAAAGFVDWLSIGSPASCKNALTVGASRSDRISGGYSQMTYGTAWPGDFPDPPIASERISGNPECLAAFSSRGPCDDRRIKPDLVGPGTDIASTKSSLAPLRNFWGAYPNNARYAFNGGTSMSAPLIAGCAALVREYYESMRNHQPSAALVKATLVNGTRWLSGADSIAPAPGTPNFHQGFGCVNMATSVPNPTNANMRLEFVDSWRQGAMQFATTGQRFRFQFRLTAPSPVLSICMAYTDLPARALQNNLNLFVQIPDNSKVFGNTQLPMSLNIPDPDNNVEIVRLQNAAAGTYIIQISATNLLRGPQDFALVVTGENLSGLTQI